MTISCMDGKPKHANYCNNDFSCFSGFYSAVFGAVLAGTIELHFRQAIQLLTPSKLHRNFDFLSIISRIIHKSFAFIWLGEYNEKEHNFINNSKYCRR